MWKIFPLAPTTIGGLPGRVSQLHEPGIDIHFLGTETVTVEAGRFTGLHFCYGDPDANPFGSNTAGEHPRYHVWTSADGDYVLLKARVDGYMETEYELVALTRGDTGAV